MQDYSESTLGEDSLDPSDLDHPKGMYPELKMLVFDKFIHDR